MAASSKVSQNKRGRDEYWNGGLALPDAKRSFSGSLVHDSDLMALIEQIDNMDAINSNPEETHTETQLQDEILNGVLKSLEDEVGLKEHVYDVDEKGSAEMVSIKEMTDCNPEATSVSHSGDLPSAGNLTYYDDVRAELGCYVDHTAVEFGIIMNLINEDSMTNIYWDAVYGYSETVYESLWEDDIWQFNEHPVIPNDFASPSHQENGISGA